MFNNNDNFFSSGYFGELNPDTEDNSLYYEKQLGIGFDNSIIYKYNNVGFRCDDFVKNHDGLHILFGGCSETEGASNLLEDVWAHLLYDKIKKDIPVSGYYNVGKTGLTTPLVMLNVLQYINDYGIPDYIFLQFPDQGRYMSWSEEKNMHPVYKNKKEFQPGTDELADFFVKNSELSESNINLFFSNFILRTLIQVCKINNIKIFWSTWHPDSHDINMFSKENGNCYVSTSPEGRDHWDVKINDLLARDGYHFGKGFHKIWAEKFYKEFLDDQNNKKNIS